MTTESQLLATVDHLEAALADALEALRRFRIERAADKPEQPTG